VRRRRFLASAAGVAVSPALPPHAASAAAGDPGVARWTWNLPPNRYEFSLRGAAFTCDCFGPDPATNEHATRIEPPGGTDAAAPANAVLVGVGARRAPVSWNLEALRSPDAFTLVFVLRATDHPLEAEVTFAADSRTGLLSRHTVLRHSGGGADVEITATLGLWVGVHEPIDRIIHLAGAWAEETQVRRERPGEASLVMESRAGKTGFAFQPYVALRAARTTYLCQILWSGNWMLRVVPHAAGAMITAGLNDWKFRHRLSPGHSLTLPTILFGRFEGGLNHATQRLHDYRRARRPDPKRVIPVQFNSWYPIFGEPTADTMATLVPMARRLGCEAFVLDAGWYRTADGDSAEDWQTRTGDWFVSRSRFPSGLRAVGALCRAHGLRFGLWFEPEVIGPPSAIRSEHPEWLHHIDGQKPLARERAILNLGIPAARQHVYDRITRVMSALGVGWMKWDFNADLGPGGWAPGLPERLTAQDPLVAHYRGLYRLQDSIRAAFPDLILEMCASGGGRMDGEILARAHVNWISDQPGPLRKLAIHFGTQLAHPAVVCNDWLVEWPPGAIPGYDDQQPETDARGDLAFRLRVAMLGSFGVSAPMDRWTESDIAIAAAHIAVYRARVRALIQHGDQYFLTPAPPADGNGDWAAIWYAAKDGSGGALFAFRLMGEDSARDFALPGLLAQERYRVRLFSGASTNTTGAALATRVAVTVAERFDSELILVGLA